MKMKMLHVNEGEDEEVACDSVAIYVERANVSNRV